MRDRMWRVLAAVALPIAVAGCSEAAEPQAPDVADDERAATADQVAPDDSSFRAADAVEAIQAAGLEVGEVRDNSANCSDLQLGCEAITTTDYVSVHQWPTAADADTDDAEAAGPGREKVRVGRLWLHFGGDSDVWPFDTAPYVEAVEQAIDGASGVWDTRTVHRRGD